MNPLLLVTLIVFAGFVIVLINSWFIHILQTKRLTKRYGWGSYNEFKHYFNRCDWECTGSGSDYCLMTDTCMYYNGIIKFDNVGMVMKTPVGWLLAEMYASKYMRKRWAWKHGL